VTEGAYNLLKPVPDVLNGSVLGIQLNPFFVLQIYCVCVWFVVYKLS